MFRESIGLGRIAGIRIGLNWSWLFAFGLIVWTWATGIFPSESPGLSEATYYAMAAAAAVFFFLTLVAHELGHALQARREGMEIEGITLWLFGGVAKFRGMFESAGAEFRIAIAGPLVSLVLGVALVLAGWLAALPEVAGGVVRWVGFINILLLLFNLLPALPLDGGRVLRAALWQARGDFGWATRLASSIGRGFGYLLIAGGVLLTFVEGAFSGLWLAFLGWFLLAAAGAEGRYAAARRAFGDLRVRDVMVRDPVSTRPDATLGQFMDAVLRGPRHAAYPVADAGRAVGLLPFGRAAEVPRGDWSLRLVRDSMLPLELVPVVAEDDPAIEAAAALGPGGRERALVLDGERLVGLLSVADVARALELRSRGGPRR